MCVYTYAYHYVCVRKRIIVADERVRVVRIYFVERFGHLEGFVTAISRDYESDAHMGYGRDVPFDVIHLFPVIGNDTFKRSILLTHLYA